MKLPVIKSSDTPEKQVITYILRKRKMRMKDLWENHSRTRRYKKPITYWRVYDGLNRSVSLTRTVNLMSALGYTIAIVPTGANVSVESKDGARTCGRISEHEIVMITADAAGCRLTQASFRAEPQSPREEW